jgi:hypothetical protein
MEDRIMKVLLELSNLLQNKSSHKIVSQLEALKKLKEVLKPGKLFPGGCHMSDQAQKNSRQLS